MFNIIAIRLREQYVRLKHTPIRFCRSSRQLHEQHNRVPGVGIHRRCPAIEVCRHNEH